MRRSRLIWFVWVGLAIAATVALFYGAVYAFVGRDALMVYKRDMIELKLARLQVSGRPPHVVFVSGSNTLYGLDSPHLEALIGRPVTNAAVHWGLTFFMAEKVAGTLRAGDLMILPLEYSLYEQADGGMQETEACYVIAQSRDTLGTAGDWVDVLRNCPTRVLAYGLLLRATRAAGRSVGVAIVGDRMNAHGDVVINTAEHAQKDREFGSSIPSSRERRDLALRRLKPVLDEARRRGATVAISFPVSPAPPTLDREGLALWLANLRSWAERNDVPVISDPTRHMFEQGCFYDGPDHLHRGCTRRNTRAYADAIRSLGP